MTRQERWDALSAGPWNDEPNKVQWVSRSTNLDCLIVRGPMGALCGYVGVPKGHRLYGLDYDVEPMTDLDVHGGLTYAASCQQADADGICHVPQPGRPADVWWFGFDCGHYMDVVPGMLKYDNPLAGAIVDLSNTLEHVLTPPERRESVATYRDIDYVKGQCTTLAKQIKELA